MYTPDQKEERKGERQVVVEIKNEKIGFQKKEISSEVVLRANKLEWSKKWVKRRSNPGDSWKSMCFQGTFSGEDIQYVKK
jgi:hypothetical protein